MCRGLGGGYCVGRRLGPASAQDTEHQAPAFALDLQEERAAVIVAVMSFCWARSCLSLRPWQPLSARPLDLLPGGRLWSGQTRATSPSWEKASRSSSRGQGCLGFQGSIEEAGRA